MNMYNPYIQQMPQTQDLGGLSPYYQNIGAQQAMQQQALQQGMGLTNQAGMTVDGKQAGVGMNPMAMAMMLRQGQDQKNINAANAEMSAFNQRPAQNYYSAGMNPMNIQSDMDQ